MANLLGVKHPLDILETLKETLETNKDIEVKIISSMLGDGKYLNELIIRCKDEKSFNFTPIAMAYFDETYPASPPAVKLGDGEYIAWKADSLEEDLAKYIKTSSVQNKIVSMVKQSKYAEL